MKENSNTTKKTMRNIIYVELQQYGNIKGKFINNKYEDLRI